MKKIVLIGAGGHGLVCADIASLAGYSDIVFLDDHIEKPYEYPIVGEIADYRQFMDCDFFVSIGDNHARKRIYEILADSKCRLVNLIHPSAVIAINAALEQGIAIMANSVINSKTVIHQGAIVNTASTVDHECEIGAYVHLSPGCHLAGNVSVESLSWLGIGCIVSNNLTICSDCVIGASSLVLKNIHKSGVYGGVPCRKLK